MYNNLYNEYQALVQNIQNLSSDNFQVMNALQAKDNEKEAIIEQLQNYVFAVINDKDKILQRLTNEINQLKGIQQAIVKPKEAKFDVQEIHHEPRVNSEETYRFHEGTRSKVLQ